MKTPACLLVEETISALDKVILTFQMRSTPDPCFVDRVTGLGTAGLYAVTRFAGEDPIILRKGYADPKLGLWLNSVYNE